MFLFYLLVRAVHKRCGKWQLLHQRLAKYLFWNGVIQLFAVTFLDLYVSSLLNVVAADFDSPVNTLVGVSNVVSLGVFVLCNLLVLLLACVYFFKFDKIDKHSNFGALLDRTKLDEKHKSKWNLLLPALLFGRRMSFALSVLLIRESLWAQIGIMFLFSTAMVIYIFSARPFESPFAAKIEIFNECTLLVLSYGLMLFTNFVVEPEVRYRIGWYYLSVCICLIAFHLAYLICATGKMIRRKVR